MTSDNYELYDLAVIEKSNEPNHRLIKYAVDGFYETLSISPDEHSEKDGVALVIDEQDLDDNKEVFANLESMSDENLRLAIFILLTKGLDEQDLVEVLDKVIKEKSESIVELAKQGLNINDELLDFLSDYH